MLANTECSLKRMVWYIRHSCRWFVSRRTCYYPLWAAVHRLDELVHCRKPGRTELGYAFCGRPGKHRNAHFPHPDPHSMSGPAFWRHLSTVVRYPSLPGLSQYLREWTSKRCCNICKMPMNPQLDCHQRNRLRHCRSICHGPGSTLQSSC
jgi:hypothetical protein